jgi:hypothetical protein
VFQDYEGGTQFDQSITGVDFSYFKAQNGGMIFETIGSGEIKFFSAGTTQFGPTGNFTSNKMLQQSVSGYGSQINSITAPFTGSNGTLYTNSTFGLQNYGGGSGIDNSYIIEIADSSFQKYCALQVGEALTKFVINTGGGYDFDEISLIDNNDGSSTINLKADTLNVGVQTATSINIGNDGGSNIISGSTTFSTNATIGGNTTIQGTNAAPGNTFQVNDGNGAPRLQVNNATLAGITGTNVIINGNTTLDGTVLIDDNTTINGWAIQTFDDVSNNNQINQFKVNNWTSPTGHTIANSTIGWQRYDGTVHGWVQELYNGDYSYGSSVQHEPGKWEATLFASGSAYSGGSIKVQDQGDTSVQITLDADKTNVTNVMKLSQLDPLPAGTVGELAVSGSNLYFYDGSWRQVSLV